MSHALAVLETLGSGSPAPTPAAMHRAMPVKTQPAPKKAPPKKVVRAIPSEFAVRDSGVQTPALDRALALLEFISAHTEGVTTGEIRSALKFSANQTFRLTKALTVHGYVQRDESGTRFLLTQRLLSLAQPKKEERSLGQLAWPTLCWLRDATGESAHIGIRSGWDCVVLERAIGPHLFKFYTEAGARGPLHAGAPGKIMLAWLPEALRKTMLQEIPLEPVTANTIVRRETFAAELEKIRQTGYALDHGETLEGIHCVGAPVWDVEGQACASVWITAPAPRLTPEKEQLFAPLVIEAGKRISELLKS
jgi:DNA-binding IclR family transcriptional regulator